jgi:hypothetical protein
MKKLTQKIAREYVRLLGGTLKRDVEYEEYILRFGRNTYHTDALDDVIGTARAMQRTHFNIEAAEQFLSGTREIE